MFTGQLEYSHTQVAFCKSLYLHIKLNKNIQKFDVCMNKETHKCVMTEDSCKKKNKQNDSFPKSDHHHHLHWSISLLAMFYN